LFQGEVDFAKISYQDVEGACDRGAETFLTALDSTPSKLAQEPMKGPQIDLWGPFI